MSKDKYRPSITDKEVVSTSGVVEVPTTTGPADTPPGTTEDVVLDEVPGGGVSKVAPTGLRIVSQKAYYTPEGYQQIEVTFEWDSVPGATEYLLRVGM